VCPKSQIFAANTPLTYRMPNRLTMETGAIEEMFILAGWENGSNNDFV